MTEERKKRRPKTEDRPSIPGSRARPITTRGHLFVSGRVAFMEFIGSLKNLRGFRRRRAMKIDTARRGAVPVFVRIEQMRPRSVTAVSAETLDAARG